MTKAPPLLRRLFAAGTAVSHALREFRGAADRCHDLLSQEQCGDLLGAGTLYVRLFELTDTGDSLDGALIRLSQEPDTGAAGGYYTGRAPRLPELVAWRSPRHESHATQNQRQTDELTRQVTASPRKPVPRPQTSVVPPRPEFQLPAVSERAKRDEPVILPKQVGVKPPDPEINTPGPAPAVLSGSDVKTQTWSGESAARELSERMERAGLSVAWTGTSRESGLPSPLAPSRGSDITRLLTRQLAPAIETITRRYAARNASTTKAASRSVAFDQMAQAHDAAPAIERETETPLRRLAALGRMTRDLRLTADAGASPATEHEERPAITRWSQRLPDRLVALRATGQQIPSRADTLATDHQEFADRLAAVVRQEAVRNGIDPREYES